VKTGPIVPGSLEHDADGLPRSPEFEDCYHPRQGALAQARQVFLAGNGLPERWRGRERFVVLETGFGLGNNFLATWQAWRDDPARPERLHFISIEARPLPRHALAAEPRDAGLVPFASQLVAAAAGVATPIDVAAAAAKSKRFMIMPLHRPDLGTGTGKPC